MSEKETDYKGFLTKADREFLYGEKEFTGEYANQQRYERRQSIRERTRGALRDFTLLAKTLEGREREKIFNVEWGSEEQRNLEQNLSNVIRFIYAGMKGQSWFKSILGSGVRNGEVELGNAEHALLVNVDFDVEHATVSSVREAAEHIQNKEWNKLEPADLLAFVRFATHTEGFDVETIIKGWEQHKQMQEWFEKYKAGNRQTGIPGGMNTPFIYSEVWNERGYGEMSTEERREEFKDLFGEGVPMGANAVYDGEKVFRPPAPGSDEEPEILDLKNEGYDVEKYRRNETNEE